MNLKILKIIDIMKPIFSKMGINYPIMRKILYMKLLMDGRRVPTVFNNNKKSNDSDNSNKFLKSLWIYILMGVIIIPFIIMKNNYMFQMSIVFGIIMFLMMTSLISDFSSVLLDIRDKNIIGSRPVDPKTISMAKTIHIFIYMLFITAALTGPALIVSIFVQGPLFFLMFLIAIILLDIFCIILTAAVYFLVLKFFDGEKLKDIINYIQIILSIVVLVAYQLIGRLFHIIDIKIAFEPHWWQYLITPIWFSAPFQMLGKSEINNTLIIFTMMAVIIPLLSIVIYTNLMPSFEKNLQKLGNNDTNRNKIKRKPKGLLAKLLCRDKEERIFFRFALDMMRNEREFKLKVYPNLAYSMIFPFIFLLQLFSDNSFKEVTKGKTYLFIYFCGLMLPTLVMMMRYSGSYKAAWIYKALPISDMRPVYKGTMKALIAKLFFPVYLLLSVIFTAMYGVRIIPDLMVVLVNMIIFCTISFALLKKALPFSNSFEVMQQSNSATVFLLLILLGGVAGVHYLFTTIRYGTFIFLCLTLIIHIILWETIYKVPPEN